MNKLKSILSLILAGALLTGSLSLLAGCGSDDSGSDSGEKDSTSGTGTNSGSGSKEKKGTYDGAWMMIGYDGEMEPDCFTRPTLLWISGNSADAYQYDEDKDRFVTESEYYADRYADDDDYSRTSKYEFDSKTGKLTGTMTDVYDGETETETMTATIKVNGYNATMTNEDGDEVMFYWISADSPKNLTIGLLDEGFWYTGDREYGLAVDRDDVAAELVLVKFASTENWTDEWFDDGENVASFLTIGALIISDKMIGAIENSDGDYELVVLDCSLKSRELTIKNLDSVKMVEFGNEDKKVDFSSSSLTFKYSGEID